MLTLITNLVEFSRRNAALVTVTLLLLAIAGGYYAAGHFSIDTDVDKLINPNLPWRQREKALDTAFPQNVDLLLVVVDAKTPDEAEDGTAALARRLAAEKDLFKTVRRPDGGEFFRKNGLLFLSKQEVQSFADQLISAQPLIGTLAADPTLRGVFDALDLLAQGVLHGDADAKQIDGALSTVAQAAEAALAGRHEPISWQTMISGRKPEALELRRFIFTQPRLDYNDVEPGAAATAAIHEAARQLGLTAENGMRVRVTGPVALSDAEFATLTKGAGFSTALSVGLLCLWLMLALRSLRLFIAILTTLVVGLVACGTFAIGVVGPLNPISIAFAVLFVGIAVDFGIQFSVRYRDERYHADNFTAALRGTAASIGATLGRRRARGHGGLLLLRAHRLYRRLRARPHRRRRHDHRAAAESDPAAGAAHHPAAQRRAAAGGLRPRRAARPLPGRASPPGARGRRGAGGGLPVGAAVCCASTSIRCICRTRMTEAVSTLFDLMADPSTTPYTIDVMTPSVTQAAPLADRLEKLPEVAQALTAESYVPDNQKDKLAIIADAAQLLGPTLSPPQVKPAPDDRQVLATIAKCAGDMKQVAARGSAAAGTLAQALDRVLARGASVLPALEANVAPAIEHRLDDLRLSLQAAPVTLESLPPSLKSEWISPDGQARVEVFPKGDARNNDVLRRFAMAVERIAPDATGTPITIQESARTVTHAFLVAGIIAIAAISVLLALVLRRLWRRARGAGAAAAGGAADAGDERARRAAAQLRQHHRTAAAARHRRRLRHLFRHALARRRQRPAAIEHGAGDPVQRAHHRHRFRQPGAVQPSRHVGDGQAADDRAVLHAALHLLRPAGAARPGEAGPGGGPDAQGGGRSA